MKRCLSLFLSFSVVLFLFGCREKPAEQPTLLQKETTRKIMLSEIYMDCEHRFELESEQRSSLESEEELCGAYPDFTIHDFQMEQATLIRYKKGKCNEHYLFKEYRGRIGVFRENNGALLDVLNVPVSQLRQTDRKMLKGGISVYGKEECAALSDDFAS